MTPHSPKVSVIVPNYNHAPYLRKRIESVLNQTFQDYELILLDDFSTDASREILEEYRDHPKVSHLIFNQQNSGTTFAQWKKGIDLAKGVYVWLAESDDFASESFLEELVTQLDEHPAAAIAFSGSHIVDSDGNDIPGKDWDRFRHAPGSVNEYTSRQLILSKLLRNNKIYNASMAIFRRSAAPEIDSRYLSMRYCGDWLFWVETAMRGGGIEVCKRLNYFRQHHRKVSPGAASAGLTYIEGLPIVVEMARRLDLSMRQRKVIAGRLYKRLRKFPAEVRENPVIAENMMALIPGVSLSPRSLIAYYILDKYLHFSHLPKES